MATITALDGTDDSTTPTLVLGYETTRESSSIVHRLIGGGVGVTLIPSGPRSGTLELLYPLEDDAAAALELHARPTRFYLAPDPSERQTIEMVYVVAGQGTRLALDTQTRDVWVLSVGYQEVPA